MENILYWNEQAVGIDCGTHIAWFPSAPVDAIEELSKTFRGYMNASDAG
jgi:hypothetical protein